MSGGALARVAVAAGAAVGPLAVGRRTVEEFAALLAGEPRSAAGTTAPAQGLALAAVHYGDASPVR